MLNALYHGVVSALSPDLDLTSEILSDVSPKISKRAKRLSLRVNPKTSDIELVIPRHATQHSVERFVRANREWIYQRQTQLPSKLQVIDGIEILYRGIDTTIHIHPHTKRTTTITHTDDAITIATSRGDPTTNFKRWVIEQARTHIEPLAHAKAAAIDKPITKIDLRDTSSRWGSCSSDGRLMLSWRLIFAPDYVLDYVVGHEVAHLKYMDHGKAFWALCYSVCDKPDEARQWLKINGNQLLRLF